MRHDGKRHKRFAATMILSALLMGCASPPAVTPLLRVVEEALRDEAARVEAEASVEAQRAEQTRRMLADVYRADLLQRDALDVAWIEEATAVYVAACEDVLRHELDQQAASQHRASNLRTAASAQRRAIQLLDRQDDLITGTLGIDLWQLLEPSPEPSR